MFSRSCEGGLIGGYQLPTPANDKAGHRPQKGWQSGANGQGDRVPKEAKSKVRKVDFPNQLKNAENIRGGSGNKSELLRASGIKREIVIWGRKTEGFTEEYGRKGPWVRAKGGWAIRGEVWDVSCPSIIAKGAGRKEEWGRSPAEGVG